MKSILLFVFIISSTAHASMYKCTGGDGRVSYQERPCDSGDKTSIVQSVKEKKLSKWNKRDKLNVSDEVVRECYEGYRRYSLDPSRAEMLGHSAMVADAGFPVLHVSAVFRNRMGGPDRRLLWCRLTDDLVLDKNAMDKKWGEYFRETF